tara:strand:- start:976 stop:1695 length:720 start_codon:yes stop_codon:yes gene_type:complete
MTDKVISKDSFKRIIKDVKDIIVDPLTEHNIYYKHDNENILKGHAMIIGPKDSCYYNGFFFFEFNFPHNYPWAPPKVIYNTNDGKTRFNPNLYRDGKVCLSVLNTWKGESWSSCQTIKSILLTILSILNNEPLLNEPGVNKTHEDFIIYNEIVTYKSYEHALIKQYNIDNIFTELFKEEMNNYIKKNRDLILQKLNENNKLIKKKYKISKPQLSVKIYGFNSIIDYSKIIDLFNNIKIE